MDWAQNEANKNENKADYKGVCWYFGINLGGHCRQLDTNTLCKIKNVTDFEDVILRLKTVEI